MITRRQAISFPLDANLDQGLDDNLGANPGTMTNLVNLRKDNTGRLVKRNGYGIADVTIFQESVVRGFDQDGSSVVIDRGQIISYSNEIGRYKDRSPRFRLNAETDLQSTPGQSISYPCCASVDGSTYHIWVQADTAGGTAVAWYMITDGTTGAVTKNPTFVPFVGNVKLCRIASDGTAAGTWIFASVLDLGVNKIKAFTLNGLLASVAETILETDATGFEFDCCVGRQSGGTTAAALIYPATGPLVKIIKVGITPSVLGTVSVAVTGNAFSTFSQNDTPYCWINYVVTAAPTFVITKTISWSSWAFVGTQTSMTSARATVHTGGCIMAAGDGIAVDTTACIIADCEVGGAPTTQPDEIQWVKVYAAAGGGVLGIINHQAASYGAMMTSAPFSDGRNIFCFAEYVDPLAFTVAVATTSRPYHAEVLIQLTFDTAGGQYVPGNGVSAPYYTTTMPHLRLFGAGRTATRHWTSYTPSKILPNSSDSAQYLWLAPIAVPQSQSTPATLYAVGASLVALQTGEMTQAHFPCALLGETITTGGAGPYLYDGQRYAELGFVTRPFAAVALATAGGFYADATSYQHAITYEYTDHAGYLHQSAPYILSPVTYGSSGSNANKSTLTISTLRCTAKQDFDWSRPDLQIVIWRTDAGPGPTFFRLASVPNTTAATITYVDDGSGIGTAPDQTLYISRGELANECPPPLECLVPFAGRLAGIDSENRNRIVFCKPLRSGLGPAFSSLLDSIVQGMGELTVIAEMDGSLYGFSKDAIAIVAYGTGQDATGAGEWPQAQIISRAAGCIDPRALCVTQDGIVFLSRGNDNTLMCWLLPRGGGNIIPIGQKVKKYLVGQVTTYFAASQSFPVQVTSCVNWEDKQRVVITLAGSVFSGVGKSIQLEYDYLNKGQDGLGVWNASYSGYFDAFGSKFVSCSWISRSSQWRGLYDGHAQYSSTAFGNAGVGGPNSDTTTDGSPLPLYIPWYIELAYIKPGGATPVGRLNSVNLTLEAQGHSLVTMYVTNDRFGQVSKDYDFNSVTAGQIHQRQFQPPTVRDDAGRGFKLAFGSSETSFNDIPIPESADMLPLSVAVEYLAVPGIYRPSATDRGV